MCLVTNYVASLNYMSLNSDLSGMCKCIIAHPLLNRCINGATLGVTNSVVENTLKRIQCTEEEN